MLQVKFLAMQLQLALVAMKQKASGRANPDNAGRRPSNAVVQGVSDRRRRASPSQNVTVSQIPAGLVSLLEPTRPAAG